MSSKFRQQGMLQGKRMLAVILAASVSVSFPAPGLVSKAADTNGLETSNVRAVEENEVYGYGFMTMSYAEFYAGDVDNANMDAVSSATVQKSSTFPNADATVPTDDGYKINGVKNVPVKVMASASDELKARVTLNAAGTAEPTQYKVLDKNGIGAMVYNIKDTVKDAEAVLSTNSVWGDYEIDIMEKSTLYLRNTRSDIKDEAAGTNFEVGSQVQGLIFETDKGYKVAAAHMENIWVQPYKIAFSLEGNANSSEFKKLVGEKINKVTFIMPTATYVYDLGDGVYIKPAYQNKISGNFNADGTKFTLNQEVTGLTNATIAISYREGRKTTVLLESTALNGQEYTLAAAVPNGAYATVIISSDDYADVTVEYPVMSWQKEQLNGMTDSASSLLSEIDDAALSSHKAEAEELLANESATAEQANELISELTGLINSATEKLKKNTIAKLSETIDEVKKLTEDDYTAESWEAIKTALVTAETQMANPGTQEEVEEAVNNLEKAVDALEKKTAAPPSQEEDAKPAIADKKVTVKSISGKKKQISIQWKKVSKADGYQIQYSLDKKFTKASVKNVKNVSKAVITKVKPGKKYYVRIHAYTKTDGKKTYSKYSVVKTVTVKK